MSEPIGRADPLLEAAEFPGAAGGMGPGTSGEAAEPLCPAPPSTGAAGQALYVAPDCRAFPAALVPGEAPPRDLHGAGHVFRRLDPAYYAWLRDRMQRAARYLRAGRLSASAFATLEARFRAVHVFALEHLGKEALRVAIATTDVGTYEPPASLAPSPKAPVFDEEAREDLPAPSECPEAPSTICVRLVAPEALATVKAIEAEARALGWPTEALWGHTSPLAFPFGPDWGLVCFIEPGDEVVEVAAQSIGIRTRSGRLSRFYRPLTSSPPPSQQQQEQQQQAPSPQSHPTPKENP